MRTATAERPCVAIFRDALLHYNEVYLRTEVEALRRYRSFYLGSRRVRDIELPEERVLTLRESYSSIDRLVDPVVTRIGWRMERAKPFAALGKQLGRGAIVGRMAEYVFQEHGVSRALMRKLRSLRPSLLHAYTGVSGAHILPLARKLGIPLAVRFGGYDANATDEELQRWPQDGQILLRRREAMKREVQLIITVSDFLRRRLIRRGWPEEKIVVLHCGIDTELFKPDPMPLADRASIVFFAGRLIEVKGTTYLLRAMRKAQESIPAAELVVAGVGPLRPMLEREAEELGLRVRFLGKLRPEEIRRWLGAAQLYCMPSIRASTGEEEGLSNALLEAMACGLPVIGSQTGGIPEAIADTGFLVPERDVMALASRITAVLTDANMRERMGAASRQRIVSHFNLRSQVPLLEELYDDVREKFAADHAEGSDAWMRNRSALQ